LRLPVKRNECFFAQRDEPHSPVRKKAWLLARRKPLLLIKREVLRLVRRRAPLSVKRKVLCDFVVAPKGKRRYEDDAIAKGRPPLGADSCDDCTALRTDDQIPLRWQNLLQMHTSWSLLDVARATLVSARRENLLVR
jgi:hypothetical protein